LACVPGELRDRMERSVSSEKLKWTPVRIPSAAAPEILRATIRRFMVCRCFVVRRMKKQEGNEPWLRCDDKHTPPCYSRFHDNGAGTTPTHTYGS